MTHTNGRNLFEIDNAKNLKPVELVNTFVPTSDFWRLLEPKNHIVLGARGSGKTALVRMLCHDHLSKFDNSRTKELIKSKELVGIYIPTNVEWVGTLSNKPWNSDEEAELFFQWRMNLASCQAFLATAQSCINRYITNVASRVKAEKEISKALTKEWIRTKGGIDNFLTLQERLEDIEHRSEVEITKTRVLGGVLKPESVVGLAFATTIFHPLRRAIAILSRTLHFPPTCCWAICIDEAEFLDEKYQRILNTYMRAQPQKPRLVFKVTTMPYCHFTLETNVGVPLDLGHDFEYVYIDHDPVKNEYGKDFAENLFEKRISASNTKLPSISLHELLGESPLLDPKPTEWDADSREIALLKRYGTKKTIERAENLSSSPRAFMDQIGRKIHGTLLLREASDFEKGRKRAGLYSGATMAIRCGDGNPRRLIRILNRFISQISSDGQTLHQIRHNLKPQDQERILKEFSKSVLYHVKSEQVLGPEVFGMLNGVGNFLNAHLYDDALSTDQITSIQISNKIPKVYWEAVKRAVGLALLFPNIDPRNPDLIPDVNVKMHLAYVLAPHFRIPPRRGKSRSLLSILEGTERGRDVVETLEQWQLPLS